MTDEGSNNNDNNNNRRRNRVSWMMILSVFVFLIYGIQMMRLLVSAHDSISSTSGGRRVVVFSNNTNNNNNNNSLSSSVEITEEEEEESSCWSIPQGIDVTEISPKQFMEEGGLGYQYWELYQHQLTMQSKGVSRPVLRVRFVLYYLLSTCQPVYYHIHKNGGTTMNIQDNPVVDAYYTSQEQTLGRPKFRNVTKFILQDVYRSQQQKQNNEKKSLLKNNNNNYYSYDDRKKEMPFFTFLRDPVTRFLSGVGQAMKLNKLGPCLTTVTQQQQQANASTTNTTSSPSLLLLDCVLDQINTTRYYIDEHLVPQAFELYHGIVGLDIKIQVMSMTNIPRILQHLGFGDAGSTDASKNRRRSSFSSRGFEKKYKGKFNDLANLDMLPQSMIDRICVIYKVDLLLLQISGGVTNSICPPL